MNIPASGFWLLAFFQFLTSSALNLLPQDSIRIASIGFDGNKAISTARLKNCLHISIEGNSYSPAGLESDLQNVRDLYNDEGFLRAQVGIPRVEIASSGDKKTAVIRIPVSEGSPYILKNVTIKNLHVLPSNTFMQMSPLTGGKPFSRTKAAQWQAKIDDAYHAIGYLNFRCTANENLNDKNNVVDFVLDCAEGSPYSIGKINIIGDESINPSDFKKRLLVSEGGLFNSEMLAYSIQLSTNYIFIVLSPIPMSKSGSTPKPTLSK
jgi:outer membrane protein assembly factor BamA